MAAFGLLGYGPASLALPRRAGGAATWAAACGMGVAAMACGWLLSADTGIAAWPILIVLSLACVLWSGWRVGGELSAD